MSVRPSIRPLIRAATEADLTAIKAVYDDQVRHGIATFDTEPPPLAYWEARLATSETGDHLLVAEHEGTVVGYAHSGSYRPRPAYSRTRETSVYLTADATGRGLGRELYDELLARLRRDGVHLALGIVALPNPASEALHRACGYEQVGQLPEVGYKHDRWIDTAIYALHLQADGRGAEGDVEPVAPDHH